MLSQIEVGARIVPDAASVKAFARMSSGRGAGEAQRVGSPPARMIRVWRGLPRERRLAALACVGLFLTLFLPWYQETVFANGVSTLRSASSSLTGWGAFSFVEAAVLLVAASVLLLLFVRAEGQAFHVPGGDGGVITAAGVWTCALIVWRIFDKQGTSRHGQIAYTSGIEWGIFVALAVAALLAYAGSLIRLAHEPEPPLPGERESADASARPPAPRLAAPRRAGDEPAPPRRRRAPTPGPTWAPTTPGPRSSERAVSPPLPCRRCPRPPRRRRGWIPPRRRRAGFALAASAHPAKRPAQTPRGPRRAARPTPSSRPNPRSRRTYRRSAGGGPWTAARSRSFSSRSPRPPAWAASAPAQPPAPPEPETAPEPPTERRRPAPDDDPLTIRIDRPN